MNVTKRNKKGGRPLVVILLHSKITSYYGHQYCLKRKNIFNKTQKIQINKISSNKKFLNDLHEVIFPCTKLLPNTQRY
jgi:hypothetical protein